MPSSTPPARWLGPAALGAALLAVLIVFMTSTGDDEGGERPAAQTETTTRTGTSTQRERTETSESGAATTAPSTTETGPSAGETYRVRPGDTLGVISEQTGVPIDRLEELNPGIDSSNLTVGDEVKLAP